MFIPGTSVRVIPFPKCARDTATRRNIMQQKLRAWENGRYRKYMIARMEKERCHYAGVVLGAHSDGRTSLFYPSETSGTGPFRTRMEAINWFVRQGR